MKCKRLEQFNKDNSKKIKVEFKNSIIAKIKKYKYNDKSEFEIKNFLLEIKKMKK